MCDVVVGSIRLMFSIADIQTEQEAEFEENESEEASEDQPTHTYPIRCSFSITKVSQYSTPLILLSGI